MTRIEYRFEPHPTYKPGDPIVPAGNGYKVGDQIQNNDYAAWLKFYADMGADGWRWEPGWSGPPFLFWRERPDAP